MASELHVLIVGAGIGGLALALLLEKASISYEVFEKAPEIKLLGSAITVSSIMQIFEQLGMYEELLELSRPFGALHVRDEKLDYKGTFWSRPPGDDYEGLYGDYPRVIARPDLINLLLSRVPAKRIHYGKRVLTTRQDEDEVTIKCADNTAYTGSLLVGADGAYSSVRQNLYKELQKAGHLPKVDAKPMGYSFDCVVGISDPVNPDDYPVLKEEFSEFEIVLGKDVPFTVWYMPMTKNRIGWMVTHDVRDLGTNVERNMRCSEWGPDAALDVLKSVSHFKCPYGGSLADIIDITPKEMISKVMLEDKMLPFAGQGANMSILSALELTNLLFDIHSNSQEEITRVLKEYYAARYELAKWCVGSANQNGAMLHRKGTVGDFVRYLFLNWMPQWLIKRVTDSFHVYRPQASFIPFVKVRGSFKTYSNKPSRRMVPGSSIPKSV
ncbi:hypothetical protein BGZ54_005304 [Gamsiella multidivaricata]|nr:hypothetical protein BGZ54_005304 [Gamsiella multidivaricata]